MRILSQKGRPQSSPVPCLDNPVARKLLKAQLERVRLQVEATTNGEEAIGAWEKYGPGYFQAAMFDHRTINLFLVRFFEANSISQICLYAMVSKLLGGYEHLKWNAGTISCSQVSRSLAVLSETRIYNLRLQVIALSADCQESTKQLCLNSGMDAFLSKPANKTELFSLLQKLATAPPPGTGVPAEMRTSP